MNRDAEDNIEQDSTVYIKQTTHTHIRQCTPIWVVLISHNKQSICTQHRLQIYQK